MRISDNAKISRQGTEEQIGQQTLTRFFKRTNSVLALPKLGNDVLTKFTQGEDLKNLAILALNLMRRGLIKEDATGETAILVQDAIQQWIADCAGQLEYFKLDANLSSQVADLSMGIGDEEYSEFLKNNSKVTGDSPMFITMTPDGIAYLSIGDKLQAIEDKVPGLGKTAYYWLATLGAQTFEVFTPWAGTDKAAHTWWYGEDNQEDYIEALKEYQGVETDEELAEALVDDLGPEAYAKDFPIWATKIENPLSETDLEKIAKTEPESLESQVAEVVLALIKNQKAQLPSVYETNLYPVYNSVYLSWQPGDMSIRLTDDFIEEINNMGGEGYTEMLMVSGIPYKKKEFDSWMENMTAGFKQLKNLDSLIHLIGIRNN